MNVLIVHGSTHGATARIAEKLGERMRAHGALVTVAALPVPIELDVTDFDAIVVGGRVHGDRYPWRVARFVRHHLDPLDSRPSAFFSVSLLQLGRDPAKRATTMALPYRYVARLGWRPDRIEVIAGALPWTRWGRLGRALMRRIWRAAMPEAVADTTRDVVFTDWRQVERFADSFLRFAELCLRGDLPAAGTAWVADEGGVTAAAHAA